MITKQSHGIICFDSKCRILMIKKTVTYSFVDFVNGNYDNDASIKTLLNGMTFDEKMDILTLNFSHIWYRMYKSAVSSKFIVSFLKRKEKFDTTFVTDKGAKLKRLINKTRNSDTVWEFPKGREDHEYCDEKSINAAMREFKEETGISHAHYKLLWIAPFIESYIDGNIKYINTYHFAKINDDFKSTEFKFNISNKYYEVSDVRWIKKSDVNFLSNNVVFTKRLTTFFKKIIKKYKSFIGKISIKMETKHILKNSEYDILY